MTAIDVTRERIISQLEAGHADMNRAGLGSPALDEFNAEIIRQIRESDDPRARLNSIVELMREHRAGVTA
jgi:EAL domain-containing protein (putative c-di-GMP-specific phosphodiesterase class I)